MTDASSVKRRYLALWFPFLPTDRLLRQAGIEAQDGAGTPSDAPLVLVTKQRGALRLGAACPEARRLGLAPGMTLADARALVPDLAVAEMDESAARQP